MAPPILTSVLSCLMISVGAVSLVHADSAIVGVNIVNPQRLSRSDREAVLGQLQANGVRTIRVPLASPWGGDNYESAIDFIRSAFERGIKADMIIGLQYREGAQRRPAV